MTAAQLAALPVEAPERAPETESSPERPRRWWRSLFPWTRGRTRNAAPADDDTLLIDNRTADAWALHLGYRDLGTILPHRKRHERVVKSGILTARIADVPTGTEYLIADLTGVRAVEIRSQMVRGERLYDLRLVAGGR